MKVQEEKILFRKLEYINIYVVDAIHLKNKSDQEVIIQTNLGENIENHFQCLITKVQVIKSWKVEIKWMLMEIDKARKNLFQ